ncbi:MAG: hypothetical protein ACRDSR_23050 [Pseudonocardiaceae bacterium]
MVRGSAKGTVLGAPPTGSTVDQTRQRLVCDLLREAGPGAAGAVDSILYRITSP